MTLAIAPGVLVEHSLWGPGKVVEIHASHVVIYFPSLSTTDQGPRRKLQPTAPQLTLAASQSAPALDRIPVGPAKQKARGPGAVPGPTSVTVNTLDDAIGWFRQAYSGLFSDPKLLKDELDYKRAAHANFLKLFGEGRGRTPLRSADLGEVAAGLDRLYHDTNIPSRYEVMAAHDGFKDAAAAGRVLEAALNFVDSPTSNTFERLIDAVASLPAPAQGSRVLTWPNVTILPFLAAPRHFMVMKPEIAQRMAARMRFDLLYSPSPNWHCYEALQRMSRDLLERLSALGATDYIDAQSFMWVTRELD